MPELPTPCVLVVADPGRVAELTEALSEPLPQGAIELVSSSGGDDTIELFAARKPRVVVLTASLEVGDAGSLIEVLRGMVPRDEMVIVLVGDDDRGPIRNALDAMDLKPDRFVSRPLAAKALRFAVGSGLDNVARALGELPPSSEGSGALRVPEAEEDRVTQPIGSRTTTPLRGSGPTASMIAALGEAESPAGRSASGTVAAGHARASLPVDAELERMAPAPGSNGAHAGAARTDDARPGAARTDDARPDDARPDDARPDDARPDDARTDDARTDDARPHDARTDDARPHDARADDARADDARGDDARADDTGSGDATPMLGADTDASELATNDDDDLHGADRPGELPFVRRGTAPRFSSPVDMGEVPTVVPRAATRTMPSLEDRASGPALPRPPTDRGTGVPPLPEGALGDGAGRDGLIDSSAASVLTDRLPRASTEKGTGIAMALPATPDEALALDPQARRAAMRARWEALADSIHQLDEPGNDDADEIEEVTEDRAEPLPPIDNPSRKKGSTNPDFLPVPPVAPWRPGTTSELRPDPEILAPPREPTLIIPDVVPASSMTPMSDAAPAISMALRPTQPSDATHTGHTHGTGAEPAEPASSTQSTQATQATPARDQDDGDGPTAERGPHDLQAPRERWSHPVLLSELIDRSRDSSRELLANVGTGDDLADIDELDDDIIVGHPVHTPPPHVLRGGRLEALDDFAGLDGGADESPFDRDPSVPAAPAEPPPRPSDDKIGGRDFARQLRAKMSMMAQRLFHSDSAASQPSVDVRPRHDHHTEIDLAALGEEPPLVAVTEIERAVAEPVAMTTSPGTWDTQVRERGLPDSGEIVRGMSDVAMILARMFALTFTGRVGFRKDDVEKVIYFDGGRPVFASSNEPGDRMGQLLVREGKITASQYERCQVVVAQSGRRMGEILVDFGYLKRRELLPAVRRHVEDIIYSLFGWDRGHYHVTPEPNASAERIRLSRHPASLVLEGIRRKLDRSTLEKALGSASTVIEVPDRDRLGGILNSGDLAQEERAALAAFDGQLDLAQVARSTGVDVADVLPLAWGLCVLGLATARRAEVEHDESTALVGETDLAIDRERVRARWQLVTEADYFALLGVRRDATGFEIRRAYQSARRDFAPDVFPTDLRRELARELEEIGVVLDEAFRVLRDDRLRQTYLANLIE